MKRILVIHGPNLNLLGQREPDVYGHETLDHINAGLESLAQENDIALYTFQSNAEDALIDRVHTAKHEEISAIIINPAAFTHTSIALRDAFAGVDIPFIEVHLSNVYAREPFRHHSYFSDIAQAVICGLGAEGYTAALNHLITTLK